MTPEIGNDTRVFDFENHRAAIVALERSGPGQRKVALSKHGLQGKTNRLPAHLSLGQSIARRRSTGAVTPQYLPVGSF
jgi:hypothetical protein